MKLGKRRLFFFYCVECHFAFDSRQSRNIIEENRQNDRFRGGMFGRNV